MPGIRYTIFISVLLHSIMFAAAFTAGSSSELKEKRLIDVSLIEEWKTGIQGNRPEASLQQQHPTKYSIKATTLKPRAELTTPPDISERKETVISLTEAEMKPSLTIISKAAPSVNSTDTLSGISGAVPNTSPVGTGSNLVSQGKTRGKASAASDITDSRQQQGSPGDASLRQKIRDAIQSNLVYPYIARKRRIEGTVLVAFRINQTGMPEDIRILRGSGYSMLDTAARETLIKASPFPAASKTVEIPIRFLLKDN